MQRSSRQTVHTQETEAECNRGMTTCPRVSGAPSGSSRSGGPGSLPVDPACECCGCEHRKSHCEYSDKHTSTVGHCSSGSQSVIQVLDL